MLIKLYFAVELLHPLWRIDSPDLDSACNPLRKPLQYVPRPDFDELGRTVGSHPLDRLRPLYRRGELLQQRLAYLFSIDQWLGGDIHVNRKLGITDRSLRKRLGEFLARRLHQRRVERAGDI